MKSLCRSLVHPRRLHQYQCRSQALLAWAGKQRQALHRIASLCAQVVKDTPAPLTRAARAARPPALGAQGFSASSCPRCRRRVLQLRLPSSTCLPHIRTAICEGCLPARGLLIGGSWSAAAPWRSAWRGSSRRTSARWAPWRPSRVQPESRTRRSSRQRLKWLTLKAPAPDVKHSSVRSSWIYAPAINVSAIGCVARSSVCKGQSRTCKDVHGPRANAVLVHRSRQIRCGSRSLRLAQSCRSGAARVRRPRLHWPLWRSDSSSTPSSTSGWRRDAALPWARMKQQSSLATMRTAQTRWTMA
mmetsp:Transcript_113122/g.196183  ORF Transcript_113122/g.196183 Transcript_113122/m.196183 type:complete len:301 (+) Transcript_113122:390-1292(+)